jgi:sugar lactone lactonase YvrE
MKKTLVYVILILFGLLIGFIILGDVFTSEMNKTVKNPYAYDLGDIKKIDPAMIKYKESKRIGVAFPKPVAIDYHQGLLGIAFENQIQMIDTLGREYFNKTIQDRVTSISFAPDGKLFIARKDHVDIYSNRGDLLGSWEELDSSSYITSIAFKEDAVFIADAGGPKILRYDYDGQLLNSFDGKGRTDSKFGFVVPSPYFDIAVDPDNQLWVANTGMQYIENYTDEGSLRAFWGESSFTLKGFTGCCNPAQFSILSNGWFVTCEKGLVRIKIYFPSGEVESVVATSDDFDVNSAPADLAVDEADNIYALDISRKMIRKFEKTGQTGEN